MAWTTVVFRLRDFAGYQMRNVSEVYFHPVEQVSTRPASSNAFVMANRPVKADLDEDELVEVRLEDRHFYRLEILWHDPDRSRVGRSEWHGPFMVPTSGEDEEIFLSNILGLPPRNGMIRVLQSDPSPSNIFDQYIYNEETGDLFERRAS